jgi:sorting nexin-29
MIYHGKLFELVRTVWNTENMPTEWKVAIICPTHKKGDRLNCDNYRGIALLNTAYKIFSGILLGRIKEYSEEIVGEYQCGTGRSTTDQIFSLRMILSKCWEVNIPVHQLFVDFKQAYDSINRSKLWFALEFLGVPTKLVSLCRMTITNSKCSVRVEGQLSKIFEVSSGVRQGDALSPVLFNLALEYVFRLSSLPQNNILYTKRNQVIGYADDICMLGRNAVAVKELFVRLEEPAREMGLRVNENKTLYMTTARGGV